MRKLHKPVKLPRAYLVEVNRYYGPFVKAAKTEMNAVFAVCEQLGMFYLNCKFNVREVRCGRAFHHAG